YGKKGENGVMLIKTKSQKKIDRETAIEKRRVEAEKKRKEMIERHRQAMTRHEQATERKKSVQNQKEDNFADNFNLLKSIFNGMKSIKDEVENENVTITHISAKISFPEEGIEMEMLENY